MWERAAIRAIGYIEHSILGHRCKLKTRLFSTNLRRTHNICAELQNERSVQHDKKSLNSKEMFSITFICKCTFKEFKNSHKLYQIKD